MYPVCLEKEPRREQRARQRRGNHQERTVHERARRRWPVHVQDLSYRTTSTRVVQSYSAGQCDEDRRGGVERVSVHEDALPVSVHRTVHSRNRDMLSERLRHPREHLQPQAARNRSACHRFVLAENDANTILVRLEYLDIVQSQPLPEVPTENPAVFHSDKTGSCYRLPVRLTVSLSLDI